MGGEPPAITCPNRDVISQAVPGHIGASRSQFSWTGVIVQWDCLTRGQVSHRAKLAMQCATIRLYIARGAYWAVLTSSALTLGLVYPAYAAELPASPAQTTVASLVVTRDGIPFERPFIDRPVNSRWAQLYCCMRFLAAVSRRVSRRANNHSSLRSPSQAMASCGSTTLVRGQMRGYFRGLAVSVTRKRFSASSERKRRAVSALTAHVSYWLVTAMVAGLL